MRVECALNAHWISSVDRPLVSNFLIVVLMTIRLGIHVSPTIISDATTFKACKNNE